MNKLRTALEKAIANQLKQNQHPILQHNRKTDLHCLPKWQIVKHIWVHFIPYKMIEANDKVQNSDAKTQKKT